MFGDGLSVWASVPCVVILRDTIGGVVLTVADPAQNSTSVELVVSKAGTSKTQSMALPTGPNAGNSTRVFVPLASAGMESKELGRMPRVIRSQGRILVTDLPVDAKSVFLIDVRGAELSRSRVEGHAAILDKKCRHGSVFLVVEGADGSAMRMPLSTPAGRNP